MTIGFAFPANTRNFSFFQNVQTGSGAQILFIYYVRGVLSPGVRRLEGEAEHFPAPNAEVRYDPYVDCTYYSLTLITT